MGTDKIDMISSYSKQFKSSSYIYGIKPCHFVNLSYIGSIKEKIKCAKIHKKNIYLMNIPDEEEFTGSQIKNQWIRDVEDAIEFNENLLKELENCKG